jgi:hypothetical protein
MNGAAISKRGPSIDNMSDAKALSMLQTFSRQAWKGVPKTPVIACGIPRAAGGLLPSSPSVPIPDSFPDIQYSLASAMTCGGRTVGKHAQVCLLKQFGLKHEGLQIGGKRSWGTTMREFDPSSLHKNFTF